EVIPEQAGDVPFVSDFIKTDLASFERQKQSTGERLVQIRQGDHHKPSSRPDVERIRVHCKIPFRSRRNRQLLIAMRDIFLLEIQSCLALYGLSEAGISTISTNDYPRLLHFHTVSGKGEAYHVAFD